MTGFSTAQPWQEHLTEEVAAWACRAIADEVASRGDEYDDNHRCTEEHDPEGERLFSEIEADGCCGSHRFRATGPDGRTYVLGYNHGH